MRYKNELGLMSTQLLFSLGLLGGMVIATFSRILSLLFGLVLFGVQVCVHPWDSVLTRKDGRGAEVARANSQGNAVGSFQGLPFTDGEDTALYQGGRHTVCTARQHGV